MPEARKDHYPNHYKESDALPRVNIALIVKDIYNNGFKKPQNDLIPPRRRLLDMIEEKSFKLTPEEAIKIYHLGKPERYALTSIIAAPVIDYALARRTERNPYGLIGFPVDPNTWNEDTTGKLEVVKCIALPEPFRMLDIHMIRTLSEAYAIQMKYLDKFSQKHPNDNLSQAYRRLKLWEYFYKKFLPKDSDGYLDLGPETDFNLNGVFTEAGTGIGTAAIFMASLLRVIPKICERDLPWQEITPDVLTDTAKNSFPLLARNAMLPLDVQLVTHEIISNEVLFDNLKNRHCHGIYNPHYLRTFDPSHFVLKKGPQGYRVDFRDSLWKQAEYYMSLTKGTGQKYTVGCPAMVDVDGAGSSIRKLWDWHVDITGKIYADLWSSWFEPQASRQARIDLIRKNAHKKGMLVVGLDF